MTAYLHASFSTGGPGEWRFSREFADLFGEVPAAMTAYLPYFRHELVDLARVRDRNLSTEVRLRAFLAWVERAFDAPDLQSIFESN